jgi:hypothetical protein
MRDLAGSPRPLRGLAMTQVGARTFDYWYWRCVDGGVSLLRDLAKAKLKFLAEAAHSL